MNTQNEINTLQENPNDVEDIIETENIKTHLERGVETLNLNLSPYPEIYRRGFRDGALWHMKKTWHNVNEKPKREHEIFILLEGRECEIVFLGPAANWNEVIASRSIVCWAYTDDLIPHVEEKGESL